MKTLQYLFFGAMATLLMAADCSNKDSEFYNDIFISSPGLVDIEGDNDYLAGEAVMVNCSFSKNVTEQNQNTELDVFRTTGGARSFTFSYLIERNNSGAWETVNITADNVVKNVGDSAAFGDFLLAQAVFVDASQSYAYRGGIVINTPGQYRLRFTYNEPTPGNLVLTSDSFNNNLFVTIFSSCEDVTNGGYYNFTVN